jgi:hypothetical protein
MKIIILALVSIFIVSCELFPENATKVTLEGNDPLTFILSGSGELDDLIIYGSRQRDVGSDRNYAIWEIQPINGYMKGDQIARIGKIKYGIVPEGYKQIYPENNEVPPALVPGERYEYWFITSNAPHARKYFEIRDGKAREISN